jgi:hypothetical protein
MNEYITSAQSSGKVVSKYPIRFYIDGLEHTLEQLAAGGGIGAGPLSLSNQIISIARSILELINSLGVDDNFTAEQLSKLQSFYWRIDQDLDQVWKWITMNYQNVVATKEGAWARDQFSLRHSDANVARKMLESLHDGRARRQPQAAETMPL